MSDTPTVLRGGDDTDAEEGNHESPEDWMVPARNEGADWSDIRDHVSEAYQSAEADGHSPEDIDKYLGYGTSHAAEDRAANAFAQRQEDDPGLLTKAWNGAMSLLGSHQEDYAKALRNNEVKNPQDFADAYASAAYRAAGFDNGDADAFAKRQRGAAASAEGLAMGLPDRTDFIDAAMSLTDDQETQKTLRDKMLDNYAETGVHPKDQAQQMRVDTSLRGTAVGSFTHGVEEGVLPGLGGLMGAGLATAAVGSIFPGIGTVGGFIAGVIGAAGGSMMTNWAQHEVLGVFPDTARWLGLDDKTREWDQKNHPYLDFAGTMIGNAAGLSPYGEGANFAQRFAQRQISAAIQAGFEGSQEYLTDGKIDWTKVGTAAATGELFPGLNPLGQHVMIYGPHTGFTADGALTTRVTDFASPTGYKEVPFLDAAHDPLLHMEAQEAAREPGFFKSLMQDTEGSIPPAPKPTPPKFSLKEPELAEGAKPPAEGEPRSFEIHKDDEKIGTLRVSYPEDGHAFIDAISAGKIGQQNTMGARGLRSVMTDFFNMHPDVHTVDGYHVSGANSADGGRVMSFDRDQVLRTPKASEIKELAQGYHAAGALYANAHSLFGDLMRNESGSLNLWRNPLAGKGDHTDPGQIESAKQYYDRTAREVKGNIGAYLRHQDEILEPFYKELAPHMDTFKQEHDAGTIDWSKPVANLLSYVEHRSTGAKLTNSKFAPLADAMREIADWRLDQKQMAEERGLITPSKNWDDFYSHRFERLGNAESIYRADGTLGSGASFKTRKEPDLKTAIDAGAKIRENYLNPIDNTKLTTAGDALYLQSRLLLDDAIKAGFGKWGVQDPGTTRIEGVTNAKGEPAYMNSGYARLWHNDFGSQGLFVTKMGEKAYDQIRRFTNMTTGIKLINSSVHMTQINMGVMGQQLGEALADVSKGQMLQALYHTVSTVPLVGPTMKYVEGRALDRVMKKFISGDTSRTALERMVAGNDDQVISHLIGSNPAYLTTSGRGTSDEMSGSRGGLWQAIGRNVAGDTIGEKMGNLIRGFANHEKEQWSNVLFGGKDEIAQKTILKMPFRALGAIIDDAGTLMHSATNAVFGNGKVALIPNIQRGVAADMMRSYIKRNPGATHEQMQTQAIRITNDIENKLGELNQDNAYWNKSAKQFANMTMLSTGWKFGTYASLAQFVGRNIRTGQWEFDPVSMRSTLGTLAAWAALTGTAGYLLNGSMPWQTDTPIKDLIWARTGGEKNPDGTPRRAQIFGEPKELIDISKAFYSSVSDPMNFTNAMKDYVLGATNPALQFARGLLSGEDAIGHKISQYPGGWKRFAEEQFVPIMMTMHDQEIKGTGIPSWVQQAFGVRDAPKFGQDEDAYLNGLEGRRLGWTKQELTRARKEAAKLQNRQWLDDYIAQRDAEYKEQLAAYKTRNRTPR